MQEHDPLLKVKLEGSSIGSGRISVSQLLMFLNQFSKALHRMGMVLRGEADSQRRGARQKSLKEEIALDLVLLTHGSNATVLGFDRREQTFSFNDDFGNQILEKTMSGLNIIQQPVQTPPPGFDSGVLLAWRDIGVLFEKGVSTIAFTLNHRQQSLTTTYTLDGYQRIKERIQAPQVNTRTIEGRLLMADFKEHGTRCRVHPSTGEPVLCLFDDDQKDEVLENILHFVRIVGEAKEDPTTGRIGSIKINDIQRLEEKEEEQTELLPQGSPLPSDFWYSPSLDELAEAQGVGPITDIAILFGSWPGELDDGFEEAVQELRRQSLAGGGNK